MLHSMISIAICLLGSEIVSSVRLLSPPFSYVLALSSTNLLHLEEVNVGFSIQSYFKIIFLEKILCFLMPWKYYIWGFYSEHGKTTMSIFPLFETYLVTVINCLSGIFTCSKQVFPE